MTDDITDQGPTRRERLGPKRKPINRSAVGLVAFIVFSASVVIFAVFYIGYSVALADAADKRCAALGAVAVESTDEDYVCVMEVVP